MDLFSSKDHRLVKAHLKNLIALSKVDNFIAHTERDLIFKIGERNGFSEETIEEIVEETSPSEAPVPLNDSDRFDDLFDLVHLMLVDGIIHESEIDFCMVMAEKLGFKKAIVGVLVRKISMNIVNGLNKEAIKTDVSNFIKF
ncbi:MAG: TerB family tellurite resistance protein [Cytophagales bacterium]|nr:MAG: TerB family tellurite resistance protein [Cytophagales bacterium]